MAYEIRTYGDPVLKSQAEPVTDINGKVARLVDDMFITLHESDSGLALAAPQIGVKKQIVVWDIDDEQRTIINPHIVESDGEWVYSEGCLSIPDLYVEILRPDRVLVRGLDLDGNEIEFEVNELMGRMFQHEIPQRCVDVRRMLPDQRRPRSPSIARRRRALARPSRHLPLL